MNASMDISRDAWFDPFQSKRPRPPSAAGGQGGTIDGWAPAVALYDPGDDPTDDPDPPGRR